MLLLFEYVLKALGISCAISRRDRYAFVVLVLALAILSSCAGLKKSTSTPSEQPPKDTSKAGIVVGIDSATAALDSAARDIKQTVDDINETVEGAISDVGDFFGSLVGLGRKDSVMLVPPESKQSPAVSEEPPGSEGFLTSPIKREVTFDSLGNVTVSDEFLGAETDVSLIQTEDEYIARRLEEGASEGLRDASVDRTPSLGTSKDGSSGTDESKKEGTGLLSEYGQVSIPIPPSIVPTIFGKPSINLRVNGDVAVHLAYRDNKFLATTGAFFSGSETGLDFRQEVNMSISGSVGDKIKLSTDFGSLRQFSFENLFKLITKFGDWLQN